MGRNIDNYVVKNDELVSMDDLEGVNKKTLEVIKERSHEVLWRLWEDICLKNKDK
ncbi:hypothetical protein [Chengkuizengella marina]|uniref:hypothetical protein n=1 Tax=Chengkuizengella marina TaxID=2507566 RepID=UPI00136D8B3B|nr:hypothetical protein [Chengkuizengella marina]